MLPIVLIHGYSSEGSDNTAQDIYGTLPADLREEFGAETLDINLSRWISLSDGVALDDVSFAMERALAAHADTLSDGFHVVIHSTGALVVRNWIKRFSPKPCPIQNLVHLAGANFGSGLAHIGRGQLARWARFFQGTGRGVKVLDELEFGATKTLDLHSHFTETGNDMYKDYQVQEYCIIGSQTLSAMRHIPVRYIKEDSSDNTVRTSAGNLNYNFLRVSPTDAAYSLSVDDLQSLIQQRQDDEILDTSDIYRFDLSDVASERQAVPFAIAYETAHFGDEIGIVTGSENRDQIVPLVKRAIATPYSQTNYAAAVLAFEAARQKTFQRAAKLRSSPLEWNKQSQYEGHAQLIFRLRDQFGAPVEDFDITIKSTPQNTSKNKLEHMIEDKHLNKKTKGIITFYLRTQSFNKRSKKWNELLDKVTTVHLEITAHEDKSDDIAFAPLSIKLTPSKIQALIQSFRTTIVDVTLLRLPTTKVFELSK
ncbi:hypothetical protein IEN85_15050 [Pelagicoccus sp. NFK12]|uniref:Alpha/beta hydrolase n=1 Tax=Pelagicoccus enzymogenes TaxID=2773457 RepID=A0A927FBN5_9BACT|nr:hypothetical protein [Pelagicoccus enzymogenes]MBD5780816.1 hypothetical protein [Pelagicoccus enzymogenes]MDQ8200494.1 hypothetical protein [Pelagicoccus enzymogenes]